MSTTPTPTTTTTSPAPRVARHYVWLDPEDCVPPHGLDLSPGSRDDQKVCRLEAAFRARGGFDPEYPAVVGYPDGAGKVQQLTGTHRHEAARRAGVKLPVTLFLRSYVEAAWGTDRWATLIQDIPVKDLEHLPVTEDTPPGLEDRVVLW